MNLFDLLYHRSNFLTPEECNFFINEYEKQKILATTESSLHALDDKKYKSSFKRIELNSKSDSYVLAFEKIESALQLWINYLEQFKSFYTLTLKRRLNYPHKIRVLKYENGQFIHPHIDYSDYSYASVVLNLNDDYEGGEFCFFNKKYTLKLKQGDAIIFPADCFWVHEVTPVTKKARYSINSFIKSIPYTNFLDVEEYLSKQKFEGKSFNIL